MTKFLFVYHGDGKPETPEAGKELMTQWRAWMEGLGDAIVDPGIPVGMSKTVSADGVTDDGGPNPTSGITIVEADNMDAAIAMAQPCPHITLNGGTIEVAEAMEMEM